MMRRSRYRQRQARVRVNCRMLHHRLSRLRKNRAITILRRPKTLTRFLPGPPARNHPFREARQPRGQSVSQSHLRSSGAGVPCLLRSASLRGPALLSVLFLLCQRGPPRSRRVHRSKGKPTRRQGLRCGVDLRKTMTRHATQIVTFSGIDGAGKTTQIERLCAHLVDRGYSVARVSFWDDIAFMSKVRAGVSLAVFQNQPTGPGHGALRNDKNVQTWYLTLVRSVFYLLDTLRLRHVVSQLRAGNSDYVIFDRYLYDPLAQFHARIWLARAYIRLLVRLAPTPDFAFVLDASPDEAFTRKPEYPLDFMYGYRRAFLELSTFVAQLIVIGPSTIEHVGSLILRSLSEGSRELVSTLPSANFWEGQTHRSNGNSGPSK